MPSPRPRRVFISVLSTPYTQGDFMNEVIVETKIDDLKPSMKVLDSIEDVPIPSTIQVKADGELEYLSYNRLGFSFTEHKAYTLNKWGKLRTDFPALNQFSEAISKSHFSQMEILCELYAKQNGKPLILPQFLHAIKGKPPQLDLIHIGVFDILSLNEQPFNEHAIYKWQTIEPYLKNCTNIHILPYMRATTKSDVYGFWKVHVHDGHYEGLVVRTALDTFKVKPAHDIDAVIIGINKKSGCGKGNLFAQNMVTSLKLALMTPEGCFVEIGDCASGIDHQLRRSLWKLMGFKIGEDDRTVFIKPIVICTVEYTDLFKGKNQVYELTPTGYYNKTTMNLTRFRHPRLIRFRGEKNAIPQDIGLNQIPIEYL
jgi:hypothetical protein